MQHGELTSHCACKKDLLRLASKRVMVSGAHLDDRGVLDGQAAELALELAAVPQALHHHIEEAVVFPNHVLQPWRGHCPGQHLLGWGLGIFGQLGWRRLRLIQRCLQYTAGPGQSLPASPLLCSPHVPAAHPVRRSHNTCEEVLDHWFKHMAHYSVPSPIVENHKEVAARASMDPIIVHGKSQDPVAHLDGCLHVIILLAGLRCRNGALLCLRWGGPRAEICRVACHHLRPAFVPCMESIWLHQCSPCMLPPSWRACAAVSAARFCGSAVAGPAFESAESPAMTLGQLMGSARIPFCCNHASCLAWSVSELNMQSRLRSFVTPMLLKAALEACLRSRLHLVGKLLVSNRIEVHSIICWQGPLSQGAGARSDHLKAHACLWALVAACS